MSVNRLLKFDLIRVSKLLEEVQFVIIAFVISFVIGRYIDKFFPIDSKIDDISNMDLIKSITLQLALIGISGYYIMKITSIIPFVFSLTNQYIPSSHNESATGAALAMSIIFVGVQKNFQSRIGLLKTRFY